MTTKSGVHTHFGSIHSHSNGTAALTLDGAIVSLFFFVDCYSLKLAGRYSVYALGSEVGIGFLEAACITAWEKKAF